MSYDNPRLDMTENSVSACFKMSGGNPGAINVLVECFKKNPSIDPDDMLGAYGPILRMDGLGIYDSKIWLLYKDICKENIVNFLAVLRANQLGIVSEKEIHDAIFNQKIGEDRLLEIVISVKKELPLFAVE